MPKTAQTIEQQKAQISASSESPTEKLRGRARSLANLKPWKPGQSGNPSGKRKHDKAKEIAQAIFEENEEAVYVALGKALLKGNAYAFKELAERAYGKLKETHEHNLGSSILDRLAAGRKRAANNNG